MSARRARLVTVAPSTTSHPASATSLPHWPGETHAPGKVNSATATPKLAGLNRCLPRTRRRNFDAIASAAAAGCAHRLSARKSSVRLSAVIVALSRVGAALRVSRSNNRCAPSAAAKVSAICAGRRQKSRKQAPARRSEPKNAICKTRGSRVTIARARAKSANRGASRGTESSAIAIACGPMSSVSRYLERRRTRSFAGFFWTGFYGGRIQALAPIKPSAPSAPRRAGQLTFCQLLPPSKVL